LPVRDANPDDATACAAIYAPYVEHSAISFETDAPTAEEMRSRITAALATHAWVMVEERGRVAGYAYAGSWRDRPAYAWNAEVSVYLETGRGRRGDGRALYEALFERLTARGYRMALAGMTMPNPASQALHRALGFEPVGTFRRVGWKLGAWHDVHWMQRPLLQPEDAVPRPLSVSDASGFVTP
jgi:phosphinothricin acetyltransferase